MPDEVEVAYTVKELIKGLSDRIDGFMQMMATKADQAQVAQAMIRIDAHETRLAKVEHEQETMAKHSSAKSDFKRWLIPVILSGATIAVLVIQVFHL